MNKHPVLVRKIRHLTDARYYAAMGIEWMSIHLTPEDAAFAFWHAIRDWVEGVKLMAEVEGRDEALLARSIIEAKPDGLYGPAWKPEDVPAHIDFFYVMDYLDPGKIPPTGFIIQSYRQNDPWNTLTANLSPDRIFLESDWTLSRLEDVLAGGYTGGFCFRGGLESETGVRDYEEMDAMLGRIGFI